MIRFIERNLDEWLAIHNCNPTIRACIKNNF